MARPNSPTRKPGRRPAVNQRTRTGIRRPAKKKNGNGNATRILVICGCLLALALAGCLIWYLVSDKGFDRAVLDDYIALEGKTTDLNGGAAVYVDFSDGMNDAYTTPVSQRALKDVINVLTGVNIQKQVKYYSLADNKIDPLDLSGTQIYNRILAPNSFDKDQAPIQQCLAQILRNRQPALLITDYEEYNGQAIEQQNYAKDYFVEWLTECGDLVFYKIDYQEKGRSKKLFFSIFDSPGGALTSMVDAALMPLLDRGVERFVIAGRNFAYPMRIIRTERAYMKNVNGGNYHDADTGQDLVSGVLEDGSDDAFKPYYNIQASAFGNDRETPYLPLSSFLGESAEYYPISVKSWGDVLGNAKDLSSEEIKESKRYTHFMQSLAINFSSQNAFEITGVEGRCFDFESVIQAYAEARNAGKDTVDGNAARKALKSMNLPAPAEIADMFVVEKERVNTLEGPGWYGFTVDFDPRFSGKLPVGTGENNLLRLNIVISSARPRIEAVRAFFGWPGNESLMKSVENTLLYPGVSPVGSVLWSYFFKIV